MSDFDLRLALGKRERIEKGGNLDRQIGKSALDSLLIDRAIRKRVLCKLGREKR